MATVTGYHGTSRATARSVAAGETLLKSKKNEGDWLGEGVYFWQDAPARAWDWADRHFPNQAAVVKAELDLSGCFDLLDLEDFAELLVVHEEFTKQEAARNLVFKQTPLKLEGGRTKIRNRGFVNDRDQALLEFGLPILEEVRNQPIRSIRAAFVYGRALHPRSHLFNWAHVQICVRSAHVATVVRDVVEIERL